MGSLRRSNFVRFKAGARARARARVRVRVRVRVMVRERIWVDCGLGFAYLIAE
jgi:hypothetical protein